VLVLRHITTPLDQHIASAVARQSAPGWRLGKADRNAQSDAAVALVMSCTLAASGQPRTTLLG